MGIKGLTSLIKKNSPDAIETTNLHKISGSKVAIDSSLFLYKMLTTIKMSSKDENGQETKNVSHITGIFYKTINYLAVNIEPLYIFDGKPPPAKDSVIKDRKEKAQKSKEQMLSANSQEEKDKFEKQSIRLTKEHIDDIKKLLDLMGVSYLHANGEAEAYASELCRIGYVDYVVTEDMDALAFGAPKMIRTNIDRSLKRSDLISIIDLDKILQNTNLSYEEFLDVCIMCGCDYCSNINRIGPAKSLSFIKEYKQIEQVLKNKSLEIDDDYLQKVIHSRELFKMYHGNLKIKELNIHNSTMNTDELENFLVNECKMNKQRVQKAIKKTIDLYK